MEKVINRLFTVLLTFSVAGLFGGCRGDEDPKDKAVKTISTEEPTEYSEVKKEMLHFVDAHGKWYDVDIDTDVAKHEYDWKYLVNDGQNISYEGNPSYQIRKGVDVSKYQGDIDWNAVKADGYEFAIIRIGFRGYGQNGEMKEDERFKEYIKGAHSAGMDVGVYFFSQAISVEEAIEEAEFVFDKLEDEELELPVTFDPELIQNDVARTDNLSGEQFTQNAIAFCEKIKEAGYKPMIYSNMYWEAFLFDMSRLADIPIWYADYELEPQTPYKFEYWQFTEKGKVSGIANECDIDIQFIEVP